MHSDLLNVWVRARALEKVREPFKRTIQELLSLVPRHGQPDRDGTLPPNPTVTSTPIILIIQPLASSV